MSDFTKLPREIADCMNREGATLSEDQFMLLTGYLATVQQKEEAEEASELIDLAEMLAEWHDLSRKLEENQARIDELSLALKVTMKEVRLRQQHAPVLTMDVQEALRMAEKALKKADATEKGKDTSA